MTPAREPVRRLREAAEAVLAELDIIRDANPRGGPNVVHIDTHRDLRAALASPPPALDGFAEENDAAGSGRGSTTGPRGSGLMPSLDASDGLELRDASSASPPTAEPLPDALDGRDELTQADEAASLVHDYIWQKPDAVNQQQASDAIWRIHEVLRAAMKRRHSDG